jgi:histone deacetylase 1/2
MAAQWKWPIYQLDVVAAFLYADIHEELYISLPEGFKEFDSNGMELFGRLQKALYGTKQAAYEWRSKFDKFLTSHGYITSTGDPGVYLKWSSSQKITLLGIILVYVDDLIIFPSSEAWMNSLRNMIRSTFGITDEGICTWVLGMSIDHNPDGSITLHQEKYIQDMLQQFNMTSCNPVILPWSSGDEVNFSRDDQPLREGIPYSYFVGCLQWTAVSTRPDIAAIVSCLCRFVSKPQLCHWTAAKRVLRYLEGTSNRGISFQHHPYGIVLSAFADSTWGSDPSSSM